MKAYVSYECCKSRSEMLRMLQSVSEAYVASVSEVLFKCFICFRHMLQAFQSRCCIYFTHMLQQYVLNVSTVFVLCCSKCFNFVSCKCFYLMLHMSHTHIATICSRCLSVSYGCCIQVFHVTRVSFVQRVKGCRERWWHDTSVG
jgi:hypothetical protein